MVSRTKGFNKALYSLAIIFSCLLLCFLLWPKHQQIQLFQSQPTRTKPADLTYGCADGQLGNRMVYYAIVYGLSKLNNRSGFIQQCNIKSCHSYKLECDRNSLDHIFLLSLPVKPDVAKDKIRNHVIYDQISFPADYNIPEYKNVLISKYPFSESYFRHVREEIRREFRFHDVYVKYANDFLKEVAGSRSVTYVGVHVRRNEFTFFLKLLKKRSAPIEFYQYGFDYFRTLFPNSLFVVLSDDLKWCRDNLNGDDIFIPKVSGSPEQDMAVLAHCNHSIYDYGSFGYWGAFLAGGKTMYFDNDLLKPEKSFVYKSNISFPPKWIGITYDMLHLMK